MITFNLFSHKIYFLFNFQLLLGTTETIRRTTLKFDVFLGGCREALKRIYQNSENERNREENKEKMKQILVH